MRYVTDSIRHWRSRRHFPGFLPDQNRWTTAANETVTQDQSVPHHGRWTNVSTLLRDLHEQYG